MKRTFLPYVAIGAALVAGLVCNTAFADGFKFGGRSMGGGGGGNGGGNGPSISRKFTQSMGGLNSNGNGGQQIKKFKPQIQNHGISGINLNQGGSNGSRVIPGLGSNNPIIGNHQTPKFDIKKNGLPLGGQLGGQLGGMHGKIDPKFGQNKKHGIHIGNGGIQIGPGGVKIGKHSGGSVQHCLPKPDHCHQGKNWNAWCEPSHWPCYKPCYPCHKPICYQETVYVYTQPIVVQVAVPVEKLMQVPAGSTLTLQVPNMGEAPGQVVLQMEKVAMAGLVHEWKLDTVTATLPPMELAAPVIAEILILRADGSLANGMKVELIPALPGNATAIAPPATGLDAASQAAAALGM